MRDTGLFLQKSVPYLCSCIQIDEAIVDSFWIWVWGAIEFPSEGTFLLIPKLKQAP